MALGERVHSAAEGVHPGIARAVDEVHRPGRRQRLLQHRQGRGDPHAAADQHQRLVPGREGELACRREQLDDRALRHVVQRIGDHAARLALDADAILATVAGSGQRVVAALFLAIDFQPQTDVLAGQELHQRPVILRLQVKRGDLLALLDLARNAERARATPASRRFGLGLVEVFFLADEQVGELLIGRRPGVDYRIGGDGLAKHLADGAQQAIADQRVMLG